jgi:hypothetical protein
MNEIHAPLILAQQGPIFRNPKSEVQEPALSLSKGIYNDIIFISSSPLYRDRPAAASGA